MNTSQRMAQDELTDIFNLLLRLSQRAGEVQREHFPDETSWCEAYKVFDFGRSCNPYDQTFDKLLSNINRRDEEDGYANSSVHGESANY